MTFYVPADDYNDVGEFADLPPMGPSRQKVTFGEPTHPPEVQSKNGPKRLKPLDTKGNYAYGLPITFENGSTTTHLFSLPFDGEGNLSPAVKAMSEDMQKKKIGGLVSRLRDIFLSAGFTREQLKENGLVGSWLADRTGYIVWLGRPEDLPRNYAGPPSLKYGDVDKFLTPEEYEQQEAAGTPVVDPRPMPWRDGSVAAQRQASQEEVEIKRPQRAAPLAGGNDNEPQQFTPPPTPSAARLPPPPPQG